MRKTALFGLSLIGLILPNFAQAGETISGALSASKPIFELNTRYEGVSQLGIANEANALTTRARFGLQTGKYKNLSLLAEFEGVTALQGDYNSTLNGKTTYPNVLDPKGTELNRLQLVYTPSKISTLTIGRQRIIFDDARFIGNVGWRQDEQTFDGLRFDTKFGKAALSAAYITKVNRIIADERDWKSKSFLLNASYPISDALKLTGFAYLLDFSDETGTAVAAAAKVSSTNTIGAKISGTKKTKAMKFNYVAQYANQTDVGANPQSVDLNEIMVEGSVNYKFLTLKANYEILEGNGTVGFVTPLGTVHAFQGNSDVFSAVGGNKTMTNGIKDLALSAGVALPIKKPMKYFKNPMLNVTYHDMETDNLSLKIGKEWDASFAFAITPKISALIKYADFERASSTMPASRTKNWVQISYKY
jgi:Alginate export